MVALLLAAGNLSASPVVTTLGGGNPKVKPRYLGYEDGITLSQALFHTPCGLAMDSSGNYLFVADRDNNAIRFLDLVAGRTWTFAIDATNLVKKPIGVAIDNSFNVYVLNRGNGTNGTVVEFNNFGELVATNATGLTNAGGMALDNNSGDIYVTASNTLIRITGTNRTTIATIPNAGASLQGIVLKQNGLIAACDSGRNGIYLIDPATGIVTTNAGFHGVGDFTTNGNNLASSSTAKFNQPMNVAEAGDGSLIVTDYGNHRVKRVLASGVVTNLYGVTSKYWGGAYPGWYDGAVSVPDSIVPNAQSRLPFGVVMASDGTVYTTEDYYHIIRRVAGTGLPLLPPPPPPPPPPPVPATPIIGVVEYLPDSVLIPVTSFVFNNDVIIAIEGTNGCQSFFTSGATGTAIPNPSATVGTQAPSYVDGQSLGSVADLGAPRLPDMTIKAVNVNADGLSSSTTSARFQFVVGNPLINGNNAGLFILSDITVGCDFWYSIDGVDPTNSLGTTNYDHSLHLGVNGPSLTNLESLAISSNFLFKVRAFKNNYQPSAVVSALFSTTNFVPNTISFGFASGEASSDFVASPGQFFYAPVTLSVLPGQKIFSLQFNITVTNLIPAPPLFPIFDFHSMLMKPIPGTDPLAYESIPPAMFDSYMTNIIYVTNVTYITNLVGTNVVITPINTVSTNYAGIPIINPPPTNQIRFPFFDAPTVPFVYLQFTNSSLNLMGLGWLERFGEKNLYDTTKQDLIQFSMAHDTLFEQGAGKVVIGGYAFQVPVSASPSNTYQIQIGRPSATSDGIGAPGSFVFIYTPTNGSLAGGALNSIKNVTVGQRKYIVGDCAPFRWFNAGDFGNTNVDNSDVEQVFQSAIYVVDYPPFGSDFFDSMDSCGSIGVFDGVNGYYTNAWTALDTNQLNALFDGDTNIDQIVFGDGVLDVCDVYVTYRRSLDPSLKWYSRFWANGNRVAELTPNIFNPNAASQPLGATKKLQLANNSNSSISITNQPRVIFTAGDYQTTAGSTIYIPITANIFGNYPLRLLMLNLTVVPLDGSPALTTPVQFTPNPLLGQPYTTATSSVGNYAAAWLNSAIYGLTGNASIGTLRVTLPANAPSSAAYAVHFDHASASPNGMGSFPNQVKTGLITLSNRSGSSYNDGIPDSWRMRYFFTLNNLLSQTNADADGDGLNNQQEYLAGTDPTDPKSFFKNIGTDPGAAQQPNDCVISWPSAIGKQYVIERSASLVSPNWTSIDTNSGNGNIMEYHDATGGGVRFYRVRVQ
jgi:hypothetical protein